MNKNALARLIAGTALLFFSYSAAQTYVAVIFARTGKTWLGILALLLIYGFLAISSAFSGKIIARWGAAAALKVSPIGYLLFLAAIATQNAVFVIVASALLGICAGLFWTANTVYLLAQAPAQARGRANGILWSAQAACSAIGIWVFGIALRAYSLTAATIAVGIVGVVGTGILCTLPRAPSPKVSHTHPHAVLRERRYRRLLYLAAATVFLQGLSIALIPLFADRLGRETLVSTMGIIAYTLPAVLALLAGFFLDRWGLRHTTVVLAVVASIAGCLLAFANSVFALVAAGIFMSAVVGIFQPLIGTYPGVVPDEDRASLNGVIWTTRALGITASLAILLFTKTPWLYLAAAGAIVLFGMLVVTEKTLFTARKPTVR